MTRSLASLKLAGLVVAAASVAGCKGDNKSPAGASAKSTDHGGGGSAGSGSPVAQAASQVKNPCTVMPSELVKQHIPDAAAPHQGPEPSHCSMSNGKSVVEIIMSGGFGEPDAPSPSETVAGVGEKAWVQEQQADDAYLVVFLGKVAQGSYRSLFVEYAGHDGKSHKDDAIAIARQIISTLQS